MEGEGEEEEVKLRMDDEIVKEVIVEEARRNGEVVDKDDEESDCEEPMISLAEMMDVATKLEKGAPAVGSCCSELLKLCRKVRVELRWVINLKAQQTTLDEYFIYR